MEDETKFNTDWYDLWMQQSKQFFTATEQNLNDILSKQHNFDPNQNMKQVQAWLDLLKQNWQAGAMFGQQKAFESYYNMMMKMYNESASMMMEQWKQRYQEQNPIKDTRELYELWLDCCNEVYQKNMKSNVYQQNFAEVINAMVKFWKSMLPK